MPARTLLVVVFAGALASAACVGAANEAARNEQGAGAATDEAGEDAAVTNAAPSTDRPAPQAPRAAGDRLADLLASDDYLLLDVRRPDELEERGTVEGYLNIPIEELADRLDEVPRDRPILTA